MTFQAWIAFVLASTLLLASPGPVVVFAVTQTLQRGRSDSWKMIAGTTFGDFTAMTLSLAGAGAILSSSATLFNVLKFAGAAYLIWLGVRALRSNAKSLQMKSEVKESSKVFWTAFTLTAMHPGGFLFFISFLPLFVDPQQPVLMQFAVLELTFLVLAAAYLAIWVLMADYIGSSFKRSAILEYAKKIGGGTMIFLGLAAAVSGTRD